MRAAMLLEEIRQMSPEAQAIKLADRLANVRDAKRTKSSRKLARYLRQSALILELVPESVNRPLWRAIRAELP
jgi:(p)ppGpp synthase/HD superfamily hydrolase